MESLSREYLLGLGKINPEYKELAKNAPIGETLNVNSDIFQYRVKAAAVKAARRAANPLAPMANYEEEDRLIAMRDGAHITIRIHRPKQPPASGSPIFVVYHGGGFVMGDVESEAILCRQWVGLGGVAVNVDYRLAPEHPFPGPVHDAFDALKWTASHIDELKVNPGKGFFVGGISAGGNFAAVVSHLYRDEGLRPLLTGVYLSIPSTCPSSVLPEKYREFYLSREQNKNAPVINDSNMALFAKLYKPDDSSPLRSPLIFASHKGLPPTYFQVCGMDPLRDEALIYEKILREECGVKTRLDVYPGLPHGFWNVFPDASFSKKMREDSIEALKWLLEQSK